MDPTISRMFEEARARIHDASILEQSLHAASDSASLLKILGFEILLKCAVRASGRTPPATHNYEAIWANLPRTVKRAILETAKERMPGHADFSDLSALFQAWRFVFEKARYYYELLEGYTPDESRELGEFWVSIGAPTGEAIVQYYPSELECMIYGLEHYIERSDA